MVRDGFVFYASFYEAMQKMSKADRLPFVEALCAYALEDKEPHLSGSADLAFCLIKPQLDANIKRRDNGQKGKGFGVLGGRPKGGVTKENPNGVIDGNPKQTPNVNVNVKENVKENIKEINKEKVAVAPARFIPPTLEEVKAYIAEKRYTVNAEKFFAFYSSNGWRVGKNPMKSWKQAVVSWNCDNQLQLKFNTNGNNTRNNTAFEQRTMVCHDWSNERSTI